MLATEFPISWNSSPPLDGIMSVDWKILLTASRGLFPSELVDHTLWWSGPTWLHQESSEWPDQSNLNVQTQQSCEERELSFHTVLEPRMPVIPLDRFSSFTRMKRITAWIQRFMYNCRATKNNHAKQLSPCLSAHELITAEEYWIKFSQADHFSQEIATLKCSSNLPDSSCFMPLHPFLDSNGIIRVDGRECHSNRPFTSQHPFILHGAHPVTSLIIRMEHLRLLHAIPTLLTSSLLRRFHIVGCRKIIQSITQGCVTCRRYSARPRPQMLGQLPVERVTPGPVFDKVGVDFAGPINVNFGPVRRPTVVKSYICVFVSLTVKAVHLESVSGLTTEAFLASLRRFISPRTRLCFRPPDVLYAPWV